MKRSWNEILSEVLKFRDERDWKQFHTPKNLAAAIAIESAELQEHFLWKSRREVEAYLKKSSKRTEVSDELADIIIFSLLLADRLGVDVDEIVTRKIRKNAQKYPAHKAKGNAKKYTEL